MRLEGSETQCLMVAGDRCQTSSLARRASLGFPVCGYRKAMDSVAGANRVGRALSIWACSPSLDSVARAGKVEKIFHSRPTSCLLYAFCDHRWSDPWPRQSFRLRLRCSSSHPAGCGPNRSLSSHRDLFLEKKLASAVLWFLPLRLND